MINTAFVIKCVFVLTLLCLVSTSALGGVNTLTPNGRPLHWPNGGRNIPFNPDLGNLGPMTNAEAVAQTVAAFRQWGDIPTATASYVNTGPLPLDVDETNFLPIVFGFPDGTNPIIYDTNGAILEMLFGAGSTGILGDTIQTYDLQSGEILRSVIILNGGALDAGLIDSGSELAVQVHEIGHLSGLAHSHVNGDLGLETTGPYPYDTFPRPTSLNGLIETMYFALIPGGGQETPAVDDRSTFSTLYPAPDFLTNTGSITGRIRLPDGAPVNNVSVLARNIANPFGDAVLAISGSSTQSVNNENAGVYTFNGLTPGAQYAVFVQESPSSLFRRAEFYNGADESNNVETDHPNEFIPLTAVAGQPLTGIDIILDFPPSGSLPPAALAAGSVEVPLPFPFEIGGQRFDTVFVNWDGNLTFGEPDPPTPFDSPGRAANHLFGPPRIAALWTPLEPLSVGLPPPPLPSSDPPPLPPGAPPPPPPPDPSPTPPAFVLHGVVSLALTDDTFTVNFTDVPTLRPDGSLGGPNTFSIELHARHADQGNRVTLSYGQLDARNGVAGYSCGSSLTSGSEHETDLSTLPRGLIRGESQTAIFEEFAGQDFDLDNRTLTFEMPGPFSDQFEPNNSLARARRVSLPFNTADQFADINPGDVDFYRFRASAGETLVAETVSGAPLDTLIGLFGPGGILLASNDDTAGSFSRVLLTVPSDGEYAVAVTTNPDVNFTGAGSGSGRYILTINSYRGRVLPLSGDDVTTEVPLRFAFGFQGREWSSVWVSSNGNLTFGAPEAAQSREDLQLEGFLAGPPRIAPLFTDLDPSGSFNGGITGLVLADQDNNSLTVHWVSVPRVADIGTNTFSVMLTAAGEIKMSWDAISRDDFVNNGTIVGISKGNGAADPTPTDMSLTMNLSVRGTTYEQFDLPGPDQLPSFDLSFDLLTFLKREGQERDDGP